MLPGSDKDPVFGQMYLERREIFKFFLMNILKAFFVFILLVSSPFLSKAEYYLIRTGLSYKGSQKLWAKKRYEFFLFPRCSISVRIVWLHRHQTAHAETPYQKQTWRSGCKIYILMWQLKLFITAHLFYYVYYTILSVRFFILRSSITFCPKSIKVTAIAFWPPHNKENSFLSKENCFY